MTSHRNRAALSIEHMWRRLSAGRATADTMSDGYVWSFAEELLRHMTAMHEEIDALKLQVNGAVGVGVSDADLQRRADFNRDHAAELFPDLILDRRAGRWCEVDKSGNTRFVVFTPYGWQVEA